MKPIRGSGGGKGGGGGGRAPIEQPDTLRSIAYASVLDLVSEGEIEGLANGLQSIYLDETPIQNPNGTFNFTGVSTNQVLGSQGQSYIPGASSVENELIVALEVTKDTPIVRTITNSDVNAARVTIAIPTLRSVDVSTGDVNGSTVEYAIDVQSDGGGYIPQILGANWSREAARVDSSTLASTTRAAYQMSITVDYSDNDIFTVEYREKFPPNNPWLTANISAQDESTSWKNLIPRLVTTIVIGKTKRTIYVMPVTGNFVFWEMRLNVTSGTPQIRTAQGNIGNPFAKITGKTTSRYEKSHRIQLVGDPPWDIRVRRITNDSTSTFLENKTFWQSYAEIIDGKFRYPNSAIIALRVDASQFQAIPRRAYDLKLLRVKIPTNYNPETKIYTGIWDGNFKVAWTDNPAWCFYDLLTNSRYGLGEYIPEAQVDKWTLYAIGKYCDELVPNGEGGTEPRFTCNVYLQTREEAYNVVNNMATIFRGMPYWATGVVTLGFDAPADPVYQYTNANVIDGTFNYSGSSLKARHTVALVTWNDPEDFYRQKVEYVEDVQGIERYGIVQTELVAVGCTSRSQANRVGRWLLISERTETETVAFKTGLDGYVVRPSQIIQVADEMRAGTRRGGRIVSATTTSVVLDQNLSGVSGIVGGSLSVMLANGELETKIISAAVGTTLTVAAFSSAPQPNAIFVVQTSTVAAQLFRVVSAVEVEDGVEITALAHNPNKYAEVEQNLVLPARQITTLSDFTEAPLNLKITESLYEEAGEVKVLVNFSWDAVQSAQSYSVTYKVGERNFITLPNTTSSSIDVRDAIEGNYTVRVQAINALGKRGIPSTAEDNVLGRFFAVPPANVQLFSIDGSLVSWEEVDPSSTANLIGYRIAGYRIKYTPTFINDWGQAQQLHTGLVTDSPYQLPIVTQPGLLMIKAVDILNNESRDAAIIAIGIGDQIISNTFATFNVANAGFPGAYTNCSVVSGELVADSSDLLMWNANENASMWKGNGLRFYKNEAFKAMSYLFQWNPPRAPNVPNFISLTANVQGDLTAFFYRRGATGPWIPWPGRVRAEDGLYQFRFDAAYSENQGKIIALTLETQVDTREITLDDIVISSAGTRLPIGPDWNGILAVVMTVQEDGNNAISAKIIDKSTTGPLVQTLNASGTPVNGLVDARVVGF